jgi:hypothetical protein
MLAGQSYNVGPALEFLEEALRLAEASDDREAIVVIESNIAEVASREAYTVTAARSHGERAVALARTLG